MVRRLDSGLAVEVINKATNALIGDDSDLECGFGVLEREHNARDANGALTQRKS